jgi:hypothetical protein
MKAILKTGNVDAQPILPASAIMHAPALLNRTTVLQAYNINLALSAHCINVKSSLPNQQILMNCVTMIGTSFLSGK